MFVIGLDLGQRHDHSALVMLEKPRRHALSTASPQLLVRMAQRIPLGMAYPDVVELVRHVTNMANAAGRAMGEQACKLAVDATGLGKPVVELLRRAQLDCYLTAVTITSGDRQHYRSGESGAVNVPKQDLMAGVQMALEKRSLRIAKKMKEAGALKRELLDVRMQRRESGYVRFGADGYGQRDDLVIALALAVWRAETF